MKHVTLIDLNQRTENLIVIQILSATENKTQVEAISNLYIYQKAFKTLFAVTVILLLSCGEERIKAQQTIAAASLSGQVRDVNKAAISGATVSAIHIETNHSQIVQCDAEGRFRFAFLPVGNYEIKVTASSFTPLSQKLTAGVGQALEVVLQLEVGGLTEQVNISSELPIVETGRTQVAETVTPHDVETLPLNGRNYLDLALLLPGVSRTNTGSVQRFAETSAVPGTGISVAGQRNLNNSFIVDGVSANDDAAELAGAYYSQEVIREFQVVTSGAVAEFGRASGGFVNIITQSGTNNLRGKIYGFLRSDKLDARNPLALKKDPLTQTQYGASLGGRILKDRTFFFGNFEQTRRNDTNIITIAPENAAAINSRLGAVGYRGALIETGLVPGGYDTTSVFGRLDHRFNEHNSFVFTYNLYDIKATNARSVGGLNAVSRGTDLANRDQSFGASNITTIGSRSLNEFRFQHRRSRLEAPVKDITGPAVNISGISSFGTAISSPTERDIDLFQLSDSFSAARGQHSFKAGAEFLFNSVNIAFPGAIQGVYTFTSLSNFLNGGYSLFQQAFGAASQAQRNPNFGLFAQDEWKLRRDLTLNFGLRYDLQFLPDPVQTDRNNFSPRFGFAFAPGDRKTVLRGSFGLFYNNIPLRATSNALQRDGSKYVVVQLARTAPGAPAFPNVLPAVPSTLITKPNVTRIDPNIKSGSSRQVNLQIERELPFDVSLSVGYLHLRGMNILMSRNVNVPRCASSIDANLCRPDPNFGNISRYESIGNSYYNGLIVSFNKRQSDWASVRVSYTFSKAIDDAGNFFFSSPQNNLDIRDDRGLSDNDQRHRLTLSGSFNNARSKNNSVFQKITGGFQLSYIFTYASRLPFNIQTGNDRNADTNTNDRPLGVGRNTGSGFDFASLDLRLSRRFTLTERMNFELLIEGFNVLNRANYSVPNNIFGTGATPLPAFGKPTSAFDPRQIQLGFRFNF